MEAISMIKRNTLPIKIELPVIPAEKSDSFIRLSNKTRLTDESLKKRAKTLNKFNRTK